MASTSASPPSPTPLQPAAHAASGSIAHAHSKDAGAAPSAAIVHTTGSIAAAVGGELVGSPDILITSLSGLEEAAEGALTFIRSTKFARQWNASRASAALVGQDLELSDAEEPSGSARAPRAIIRVKDADLAMITVLNLFAPVPHIPDVGIHPSSIVDPTAQIGHGVRIGPMCIVGPHSRIADHTLLHARVTLGANVTIGPATVLHPGVIIYDRCTIGAKCILHAGVVIGADGFGYRPDPQGRGVIKIPHIGTVEIGNAVEIGANSCIDRGKFGATTIGDGTKIDNIVQIAHNVRIGRACLICGVTGIAGSVTIHDGVILAGHVGVSDGINIGTRAIISAKAGVVSDVPAGAVYFGVPAGPHKDQMRSFAALRKLPEFMRKARKLEKLAEKLKLDLDEGDGE